MKIERNDILHVANLARLNLSEDEIERLTHEMGDIIAYVDKLDELDTSSTQASEHICDFNNIFREDEVKDSYDRDELLKNAPTHDEEYILVPNVVE